MLATQYAAARIIVADNASTDDSLQVLESEFPSVERLVLDQNYGFARGYNEALQQIDAPYIVLLNSDVEVDPSWLHPMVKLMEDDPGVGACQPKVRQFHQREAFEYAGAAGGWIDALGYPFGRGRLFDTLEKDNGQYDEPQSVFWASGAAMLVRTTLFQQLGGFDALYHAHHEEIDFCWRLKRAGYRILAVPNSIVYHVGGGTLNYQHPRKTFLNFRNSLFSILKNEPGGKAFLIIFARLLLDGLAGVQFLVKGQFKHLIAIIKAHFSFYGLLPKMLRQKRHDQQLIQKLSIGPANTDGHYRGSIIWQYYARGKRYFHQLNTKK